jgi:hypothetical protein
MRALRARPKETTVAFNPLSPITQVGAANFDVQWLGQFPNRQVEIGAERFSVDAVMRGGYKTGVIQYGANDGRMRQVEARYVRSDGPGRDGVTIDYYRSDVLNDLYEGGPILSGLALQTVSGAADFGTATYFDLSRAL